MPWEFAAFWKANRPTYTSPIRASKATSSGLACNSGAIVKASKAVAARVDTGNAGISNAKAKPCATATARRTPVNAPGPRPKATASSCVFATPASIKSASTNTSTLCAWRLAPSMARSVTCPRCKSATEQRSVEVSIAKIVFISARPVHCLRLFPARLRPAS